MGGAKLELKIQQTVGEVFSRTLDINSWSQWVSGSTVVQMVSSRPVGIGTTIQGYSRWMGRRWRWEARIVELEPPSRIRMTFKSGRVLLEKRYAIYPLEGGTLYFLAYDFQMRGFLNLLTPLISRYVRKEIEKSILGFKVFVEANNRIVPALSPLAETKSIRTGPKQ